MPPKLHCIQRGGWNEGSLSRSWQESTWILRDLNQRLDLEEGVLSFFFKWSWHNKRTILITLVSFFNEVDTKNNSAQDSLFHFLKSLTQDKELCSMILFHGPYENMDPRRSSREGRNALREEYMSWGMNDRSVSNAPSIWCMRPSAWKLAELEMEWVAT